MAQVNVPRKNVGDVAWKSTCCRITLLQYNIRLHTPHQAVFTPLHILHQPNGWSWSTTPPEEM